MNEINQIVIVGRDLDSRWGEIAGIKFNWFSYNQVKKMKCYSENVKRTENERVVVGSLADKGRFDEIWGDLRNIQ